MGSGRGKGGGTGVERLGTEKRKGETGDERV